MMTSQNSIEQPQKPIGTFFQQDEVQAAHQALREAGFAEEQLSIQSKAPEPNQPIAATKADKSAAGGIITGAIFGCMVGFLLGVVTRSSPELASMGPDWTILLTTLAGGFIGALGIGLIGVASGVNVPKTEGTSGDASPSYHYILLIQGGEEEVRQAAAVLRQHGIQV